jgi:hypothetical protein
MVSVGISRLQVSAATLMSDGDHFCRMASGPSKLHNVRPMPPHAFRADAWFAPLCKNGTRDDICCRALPTYGRR